MEPRKLEGNAQLTNEIKEYVIERGVDMVGIAPVSRFDNGPEETHPRHYMSDATYVISLGMKINDGNCDVWGEWTEPSV